MLNQTSFLSDVAPCQSVTTGVLISP